MQTLKEIAFIFLGGGAGSATRYLLQSFFQSKSPVKHFPVGTMSVNIIGSFIIGIAIGYIETKYSGSPKHWLRLLAVTGFCGGFTTFSTFSHDSLILLRNGDYTNFAIYTTMSCAICILVTAAGLAVSRLF